MKKTYLLLALCCACSSSAFGRKDNYESFLIEFTPSYWASEKTRLNFSAR